ncbi:UvrB/UvrC motif-containing protein, partial [uncultured Abyssibacter sp.]|uniref:UvrB/UvrC motif-containing protein n=1 Tax=uncultured Abyssibacter sp. TaxID=2320202 RepID=UPI0032B309CB
PEVSLVAVLDADKEGFLRSERSLIQTIGRAARNLHGKAILYADSVTDSMRRALEETDRRRAKQIAHNEEHGITPQGIRKAVADVMRAGYESVSGDAALQKVAEKRAGYEAKDPAALAKRIKQVEKAMYEAAANLEFETAAKKRDELNKLREALTGAEVA